MSSTAETTGEPSALTAAATQRLPILDWMRGLVMVLMALDHASGEFNAGRLVTDGVFLHERGAALPTAQFLIRWITHLCAPTFVFLAGTSLAFSLSRRVERGESAWSIDRHLLLRGALIAALEVIPSYFWMPTGRYLLQVLYAIGTGFILMVPLRRLPVPAAVGLGVVVLLLGELVVGLAGWGPPEHTPVWATLLLVAGMRGSFIVAYPTLPWLAILLLGWGLGHAVRRGSPLLKPANLAWGGLGLLAAFSLARGLNGYGNMALFREDTSVVQWLHVSKYPPSLTFVTLELGIMAVALAALARIPAGAERPAAALRSLTVLGRTPMFFYLLHIPLLALMAQALGVHQKLGMGAAFGFAAVAVVALLPACDWYGRYKAAHPNGWTRYL